MISHKIKTTMPPRTSRGLTRSALSSGSLAGGDKLATVANQVGTRNYGGLVLTRRRGLRLATFNVRTLNECGAAALLVKELSRYDVGLAGLQEVRWPGSGEMVVDGSKIFWSGRDDGKRSEGVGLVIKPTLVASVTDWRPVSERLLYARLRHMHGFLSVVVCYAPTDEATDEIKDTFYQAADDLLTSISKRDLVVCLGDFNAVTGSLRIPEDKILGPFGSGIPNENSDRLLALCRRHSLRIGGSWFRRKNIHRFSWYSNDGHTRKEIDHILVGTRWKSLMSCRAYRGLEFYSDHRPVVAVLKLHLKRHGPAHHARQVRYNSSALEDPSVAARYAAAFQEELMVVVNPSNASGTIDECSVEPAWERFCVAIHVAAQRVIPCVREARRSWISLSTLEIVNRCREARLRGDTQQYRLLNHDRRRSLRHDRQEWANKMAVQGEDSMARGHLHDAFKNFRRLRSCGPRVATPIRNSTGELISNLPQKLERWKQYFENLLNCPSARPSTAIAEEAEAALPSQDVSCEPPTLLELSTAIQKLKSGKAAGVCNITPEMLRHGEPCTSSALLPLFHCIWEAGVIPSDWRKGIILPLYKGKGDRTECRNYRGITLLSVPGKVFARVLLERMKQVIHTSRRREQSGFTPGRSTSDRILALNLLAQKRREYRQPLYAAYVDLKSAFDSIDRNVLYQLLKIIGIPEKLIALFRVWPASLSVMASCLAAPFVLGVPAEIYAYGIDFSLLVIGYIIGVPIVTHIFFNRFYTMEITSVYEYLEYRYNKTVRSICTFIFAFSIIIYMGIITYAPAVAFSQVTGLSMEISVLGVGIIGTAYTTVGGLKGVIWVDAIQMLIILASVLAIIIKGSIDVGGIGEVFHRAVEGGRMKMISFNPSPLVRHSFWTQTIGGTFMLMVIFTNQSIVQKFLGLPTMKKMYITSYISMAAMVSYFLLFSMSGLVMYAFYQGCAPLLIGKIKSADQLVPVFVLELFRGYYGVAGLFTAAVFSASLSSFAGGINALAAVTILDVINPLYAKRTGRTQIEPRKLAFLFKGLVLFYGLFTIAFAFLAPFLGPGLLQLALNLMGVVGAPMLALFIMGVFMPCINSMGACVGLTISLVIMFWISIGGIFMGGKYKFHLKAMLPLSVLQCPRNNANVNEVLNGLSGLLENNNLTEFETTVAGLPLSNNLTEFDLMNAIELSNSMFSNSSTALFHTGSPANVTIPTPSSLEMFYMMSYMWYSVIAIFLAVVVAFLVSWCSGFQNKMSVDPSLSFMCCYKPAEEQVDF